MEEKKIVIADDKKISLVRSKKARRLSLAFKHGEFRLAMPHRASEKMAMEFLLSQRAWMDKVLNASLAREKLVDNTHRNFILHKNQARRLVAELISRYAEILNVSHARIMIRNQSSRWGSCSRSRNLNFNYRIALLPVDIAEYIVVHELCHLRHFDHSTSFWALVSEILPDFKLKRAKLKKYSL